MYPDFNTTPRLSNRLPLLLNVAITAVALLCVAFIVLTLVGSGQLVAHIPTGATLSLNGHSVSRTPLTLQPGSYVALVTSPLSMPYQATLHISPFGTTTFSPTLSPRGVDSIFNSVLGASINTSAPASPTSVQWFSNNTWVVGSVFPDNNVVVMRYDPATLQWTVAYATAGLNYPHDLTKLPANIASYAQQLEAQHG